MMKRTCFLYIFVSILSFTYLLNAQEQYPDNPFLIPMEIPAPEDSAGGMVTAELTGDGRLDYLVTVPGHLAAYGHDGEKLWIHKVPICVGGSSERVGLPGHCGPGVAAVNIEDDSKTEVLYLTRDNTLHVVNGADGSEKWNVTIPNPKGSERWEHLVVANLRGKGDRDLLLQATNKDGYRMGRYLAAFALPRLKQGNLKPLWHTDAFLANAHNGVRVADLDGDGKDEILGATLLSPQGELLTRIPLKGHVDSIFVYDVLPEDPGLEVVVLEEGGGNRVFLFDEQQVHWETHYQHWEPQNAAVGDFDPARPGLEIWCRSRFPEHQQPFIFDAQGTLIRQYTMDDVAPEGWTVSGVEIINCIDWTGGKTQLAAAKERHESGDIGIFEPVSGKFVASFPDKADRFYVADVSGDWREEMIVLRGNTLCIYHNPEKSVGERARLWEQAHYRRSKMTYNYYSP